MLCAFIRGGVEEYPRIYWKESVDILSKFSSLSAPEVDNFRCMQWQKFRQHDEITVSLGSSGWELRWDCDGAWNSDHSSSVVPNTRIWTDRSFVLQIIYHLKRTQSTLQRHCHLLKTSTASGHIKGRPWIIIIFCWVLLSNVGYMWEILPGLNSHKIHHSVQYSVFLKAPVKSKGIFHTHNK